MKWLDGYILMLFCYWDNVMAWYAVLLFENLMITYTTYREWEEMPWMFWPVSRGREVTLHHSSTWPVTSDQPPHDASVLCGASAESWGVQARGDGDQTKPNHQSLAWSGLTCHM